MGGLVRSQCTLPYRSRRPFYSSGPAAPETARTIKRNPRNRQRRHRPSQSRQPLALISVGPGREIAHRIPEVYGPCTAIAAARARPVAHILDQDERHPDRHEPEREQRTWSRRRVAVRRSRDGPHRLDRRHHGPPAAGQPSRYRGGRSIASAGSPRRGVRVFSGSCAHVISADTTVTCGHGEWAPGRQGHGEPNAVCPGSCSRPGAEGSPSGSVVHGAACHPPGAVTAVPTSLPCRPTDGGGHHRTEDEGARRS
jgi:hypothetical protein